MGADDHADPDAAGQLHHLELCCSDLEVSLPVWEWLLDELGYERKNDWDGGRSWRNGPAYLVLKEATAAGDYRRRATGLDHVAFHAASRDQVDRIADEVRSRETTELLYPDEHPHAGGYYAVYFADPDGITVEVIGPTED